MERKVLEVLDHRRKFSFGLNIGDRFQLSAISAAFGRIPKTEGRPDNKIPKRKLG